MIPIGFHDDAGALVMVGREVFPAGTLTATAMGNGVVRITSLADRVEFEGAWTWLARLDGSALASEADAMAYLQDQFARRPSAEVSLVDGGSI